MEHQISSAKRIRAKRSARTGVLAVVAIAAVLFAALAAGAGAGQHARLVLLRSHPVVVAGHGFPARARVKLAVFSTTTARRSLRANRAGGFRATFDAASIDRCTGWRITATSGHHAPVVIRGTPKPGCAPAMTP